MKMVKIQFTVTWAGAASSKSSGVHRGRTELGDQGQALLWFPHQDFNVRLNFFMQEMRRSSSGSLTLHAHSNRQS